MGNENNCAWTSELMIENANNWSLAGDVALLNRLKNLSDFLISETNITNVNIDNLLDKLETVSLKLDLTKNEFQSLRNTQFIENRVYEDDETLGIANDQSHNNEDVKEDKETHIKDSLQKGLDVINKYFDKIEVAVSDSEDEETEKSYILQPKDVYTERPLPYVIGTQEWYKKWHVGFLSESDTESEKQEDDYSTSNSDNEIVKDKILGSETSSELEFNNKTTGPVAHSTFNDSPEADDNTSESSSQLDGSLPSKTPISNTKFAEQLAAKLDSISGNVQNINRNAIKSIKQPSKYGNLYSDEPPTLTENDETKIRKENEDIFSTSHHRLDKRDDLFSDRNINNHNNNLFLKIENSRNITISNKPKLDLFDESSSDDDISAIVEKRKTSTARPYLENQKITIPFVDDKPPEISSESQESQKKKKPIGGVSVFGQHPALLPATKTFKKNDLFDESSSEDEVMSQNSKIQPKLPSSNRHIEPSEPAKKLSLFDDDDDDVILPTQSKILPSTSQQKQRSFFDYNDDNYEKSKEVAQKSQHSSKTEETKSNKKISLFDDDLLDDDLFSDISAKKTLPSPSEKSKENNTINLFDSDDDFNDDDIKIVTKKEPLMKDILGKGNTKPISLFDDSDNPDSDAELFGEIKRIDKAVLDKNKIEYDHKSLDKDIGLVKSKNIIDNINQNLPTDNNDSRSNGDEKEVQHGSAGIKEEITKTDFSKINQSLDEPETKFEEKNLNLFDSADANSPDDEFFISKDEKNSFIDNKLSQNFDIVGINISVTSDRKGDTVYADEIQSSHKEIVDKIDTDNQPNFKGHIDENIKSFNEDEKRVERESEKYVSPPPISLFDANPPPDTEWDVKSDNSAESDTFSINDAILDHMHSSAPQQRTSLFDNEPPSLDIINDTSYSSGIVKDLNITRVDTDDSSFYPYASSSRRLSSDVFNEQQSQDSFFVTKSSADHTHPRSLEPIKQKTETSSKIDYITPSGSVGDLNSDSVFEQSKSDLIVSKIMNDDVKSVDKIDFISQETNVGTKIIAPKPFIDLFTSAINENISKETMDIIHNKPSPGKLKHNLNINVAALMPGARPLPKVNVVSSPDKIEKEINQLPDKQEENDDGVSGTEVLISVTKHRAKIPVKRRPSTRHARQEAARKSMTEFGNLNLNQDQSSSHKHADGLKTENSPTHSNPDTGIKVETTPSSKAVPNSSQDSTNSESNKKPITFKYLGTLNDDNKTSVQIPDNRLTDEKPTKIHDQSIPKVEYLENTGKSNIFDKVDSSSDDDFFMTVSKNSKTYKTNLAPDKFSSHSRSLFSDKSGSDSDSELFGAKTLTDSKKKIQRVTVKKPNIFDDSDDSQSDTDLFGSKSTTNPEAKKVSSIERGKTGKTVHIRKLQNKEVTNFDPLSALK